MIREPDPSRGADRLSRRAFVVLGAGALLGGCASSSRRAARDLPSPPWDARTLDPAPPPPGGPAPRPSISGVIPRRAWAGGPPADSLMNRMLPVRAITVHHDAMYFQGRSEGDGRARLEAIRRGHRGQNWGDIGYHFAVDRQGRVYEGRSLTFQGAHVKNHNEGNIGIVLLGNFEEQQPSGAQLAGLQRHLSALRRQYRVSAGRVLTHREWPTARTLCPGRSLQAHMVSARRQNAFA